jgi:hypothetical protein
VRGSRGKQILASELFETTGRTNQMEKQLERLREVERRNGPSVAAGADPKLCRRAREKIVELQQALTQARARQQRLRELSAAKGDSRRQSSTRKVF